MPHYFCRFHCPLSANFPSNFARSPPPPDISLYRYKFFATPKVRRLSRRSNSRVTHRHRPRLKLLIPDTLVFNVEDDPQWYYTDKVQQYYNDRREHTGFFSGVYFTGEWHAIWCATTEVVFAVNSSFPFAYDVTKYHSWPTKQPVPFSTAVYTWHIHPLFWTAI